MWSVLYIGSVMKAIRAAIGLMRDMLGTNDPYEYDHYVIVMSIM